MRLRNDSEKLVLGVSRGPRTIPEGNFKLWPHPYRHGVLTLLRYRSLRSFGDVEYIMTRLGDKLLYGLVMMSLFWGEGRNGGRWRRR